MDVDDNVIDECGVKCVRYFLIYEYIILIGIIYFDMVVECVNVVLYCEKAKVSLKLIINISGDVINASTH